MPDILEILLNAMFTGFGVAIGTYLANNHFLKKMEKLLRRFKDGS